MYNYNSFLFSFLFFAFIAKILPKTDLEVLGISSLIISIINLLLMLMTFSNLDLKKEKLIIGTKINYFIIIINIIATLVIWYALKGYVK